MKKKKEKRLNFKQKSKNASVNGYWVSLFTINIITIICVLDEEKKKKEKKFN